MVFRQFVSEAEMLTLDANGRFLIPKRLLDLAEIKLSVKFLGVSDVIEIWAAEKLEKPFLPKNEFSMKLKALMVPRIKKEQSDE